MSRTPAATASRGAAMHEHGGAAAESPDAPADDDHPMTGWEPSTPLSDSLVHRSVHAYAASLWRPVAAVGGHVHAMPEVVVHDLRRPAAFENGATLLAPLGHDAEDVLDHVEAELAAGHGRVWLWSAWPTPDLRGRGWELSGHPPLLVRPAGPPPPWPTTDATVEEVHDAGQLATWQDVVVRGYPLDEIRDHPDPAWLGPQLLADGSHRCWLARIDGRPIAAGALHVAAGMAVFAMGATLPAARGRGAWAALAATRLAIRPDLPAVSLFSDHSRPLAERLGFVPIHRWTLWTRPRP